MPSWNIHTAHVERLLMEKGADALGIKNVDAFLLGNVLPDIYVGYMVKNTTYRIDYKLTHLTLRSHIPIPRQQEFWDFYIENPQGYGAPCVSDVVRGAWCHLVCDNVYNTHTRNFLQTVHMRPGECARVRKQADFADFGRTLDISMVPVANKDLYMQCEAFPMYSVARKDVEAAIDVCQEIVHENQAHHIEGTPDYQLLTPEFFETARSEAHQTMVEGLEKIVGQ